MALSFSELQALSLDELKRRYDQTAESTVTGLGFLREEIAHREASQQTDRMLALTEQMRNMTIAISILTVANVIVAAISVYFALS